MPSGFKVLDLGDVGSRHVYDQLSGAGPISVVVQGIWDPVATFALVHETLDANRAARFESSAGGMVLVRFSDLRDFVRISTDVECYIIFEEPWLTKSDFMSGPQHNYQNTFFVNDAVLHLWTREGAKDFWSSARRVVSFDFNAFLVSGEARVVDHTLVDAHNNTINIVELRKNTYATLTTAYDREGIVVSIQRHQMTPLTTWDEI